MKAAIAALAADRKGKFWEFHDLLFLYSNSLSEQTIGEIALELGLDMKQFEEDLEHPAVLARLNRDTLDGSKAGLGGVTSVFVNGRLLKEGALEGLIAQVERELAETRK